MNSTLVVAFLRQRFGSPMRLALLALCVLFPLGGVALMASLAALGNTAGTIALIVAAGGIGQDVSAGTLQLILVRPVTRSEYLFSRWLAASLAAIGMTFVLIAIGVVILFLRQAPPQGAEVASLALGSITAATGNAAVVIMLSALAAGLADIGIYFAAFISAQILAGLASIEHWTWLTAAVGQLQKVLSPEVSFAWLGRSAPVPWFALVSWASTVTLALAIGIASLNRRELSYAAG